MVFSDLPFLFYFLPAALPLCLLAPARFQNAVLLLCSLAFCLYGEPRMLWLCLLQLTLGYLLALVMEKKPKSRALLLLGVALALLPLALFKYADFLLGSLNALGLSLPLLRLALPLGISFYSFQLLGYLADVWRQDAAPERSFVDYLLYMLLFFKFTAGPILSYRDVAPQLKIRSVTAEDLAAGLQRFLMGLAKKVLIADALSPFLAAYRSGADRSVLFAWGYLAATTLQLYFDFSGYSDMALALARMLGFHLPENFDHPLASRSATEFWRRWHISLGRWFREYLYIPLGGNRVPPLRWYCNLLCVWMATGLWHGAAWTFLLWGLFFALLLVLEKRWLLPALSRHALLSHLYLTLAVGFSFLLFSASSFAEAADFGALFGAGVPLLTTASVYYLRSFGPLLLMAALGSTPLPARLCARLEQGRFGWAVRALRAPFLLALLLLCTAGLVDGSFNPFLYFSF